MTSQSYWNSSLCCTGHPKPELGRLRKSCDTNARLGYRHGRRGWRVWS